MKTIQKVIAVVVFLTMGNAIQLNENNTKSYSSSSLSHNQQCDPI